MDLFNDFHNGCMYIQRLNYGIITLLPKVKDAYKIQQYRPIYLLNCLYKWFTKVLTLRLDGVVGRIIHRNQSAFLGGRNIMTNILAMHEILHETKRRREIGVVLKLDFEKAYDKVHWGYLMKCLETRGFYDWINKMLYQGVVSVKLIDQIGPCFQSFKGVRQRDPLSPILFNFVADSLTRMVIKAQ
jgi:hypothetical protein